MKEKMTGRKITWGDKISKASKGKPHEYVKGKKFSEKHKRKIRENHSHYWLGKKKFASSEETKRKIREANLGEKSHFWKGGITKESELIRKGIDFRLWREAVFARDNWICQKTGIKGGKLHPHHIQNFAQFPELRFAIDNGITLSEQAHKEFHKKYGFKNNTKVE